MSDLKDLNIVLKELNTEDAAKIVGGASDIVFDIFEKNIDWNKLPTINLDIDISVAVDVDQDWIPEAVTFAGIGVCSRSFCDHISEVDAYTYTTNDSGS